MVKKFDLIVVGVRDVRAEKDKFQRRKIGNFLEKIYNKFRHLCQDSFKRLGYQIIPKGEDREGLLDMEKLQKSLTPNTALALYCGPITKQALKQAFCFPSKRWPTYAPTKKIVFHTDAVQAVSKIPIDLKNTKIDMLSLAGHKIHAPKGIGALFVRKGLKFAPL